MSRNLFVSFGFCLFSCAVSITAQPQTKYNFNGNWQIHYPRQCVNHHGTVETVTLPRAWNEDYAFRVGIASLPDDTCRYVKSFCVPREWEGRRVFIEFEGARQSAEVWLNGKYVGVHQNGVMAFGFDLTPYIVYDGDNRLEVLTDNDWAYRERGVST
ncbi:MAG: beta-galactosidase, partial [Bacteroidaceae bacterium]|nr:beta-galactosidase [Bacteroidaceae bacterium]